MDINEITSEFARRDDCLDQMVPSDLRAILADLEASQRRVRELEFSVSAFWNEYERLAQAKCGMPSIGHLRRDEMGIVTMKNGDKYIVHKDICDALAAKEPDHA